MILKLMDRTELFVSEAEGKAIRQALTKSEAGFITVRGTTIKKSAIMKLEEGGVDPSKPISIFDDRKALIASGCRGERSIARELMRIASKRKDFKLLANKKWREEQTQILRESGQKFCDTKTGECACSIATPTAVA